MKSDSRKIILPPRRSCILLLWGYMTYQFEKSALVTFKSAFVGSDFNKANNGSQVTSVLLDMQAWNTLKSTNCISPGGKFFPPNYVSSKIHLQSSLDSPELCKPKDFARNFANTSNFLHLIPPKYMFVSAIIVGEGGAPCGASTAHLDEVEDVSTKAKFSIEPHRLESQASQRVRSPGSFSLWPHSCLPNDNKRGGLGGSLGT